MVCALIPSYRPDEKLLVLLRELSAQEKLCGILVVDDGGGEEFADIFAEAERLPKVKVVHHAVNLGKGRALKTGINACMQLFPGADIVTADSDGQHSVKDILRVAEEMEKADGDTMVTGKRVLPPSAPLKSRLGNGITRFAYLLSTGKKVYDTQTGLRGLPHKWLSEMLKVSGERYEYEMNILLQAPRDGLAIKEIPIDVIYINDNKGSHFNPVKDAIRVFSRIFAFAASSIFCFAIDYAGYAILLSGLHASPRLSYIGARIVSSVVNFLINRNVVFAAKKGSIVKQALGYYALALVIMLLGSFGVDFAVTNLGFNEYISKLAVDVVLSIVSFLTQRLFIFAPTKKKGAA